MSEVRQSWESALRSTESVPEPDDVRRALHKATMQSPQRWPVGTDEQWGMGDVFALSPDALLYRVEDLFAAQGAKVAAWWSDFPRKVQADGDGWRATLDVLTGRWRTTAGGREVVARLRPLSRGVSDYEAACERLDLLEALGSGRYVCSTARRFAAAVGDAYAALKIDQWRYPLRLCPCDEGVCLEMQRSDYTLAGERPPGAAKWSRKPRVPDTGVTRTLTITGGASQFWTLEHDTEWPDGDKRAIRPEQPSEIVTPMTATQSVMGWLRSIDGRIQAGPTGRQTW